MNNKVWLTLNRRMRSPEKEALILFPYSAGMEGHQRPTPPGRGRPHSPLGGGTPLLDEIVTSCIHSLLF